MKFRYARHTDDLERITDFYTRVMGFQVLGSFKDHSRYDGVFLGLPGRDWHLEFTTSDGRADHRPDRDDLMVFYVEDAMELETIRDRAVVAQVPVVVSKNPYWRDNGLELADPDGFGVIIALEK
ncbi:VOC family protein [Muricauda sp. NFXS6]|uniref:VOC family protein n=1 Tax=Allomuricauda sp. NFXS6 TaxID=2819094 RepID=UPI0032E022B7